MLSCGLWELLCLNQWILTSRPMKRLKSALTKFRAVLLLFTLLPSRILKSTVPVSLMTFRMRHLTLQSLRQVFLAQICLTSCGPSVFSPPKAKWQLFPKCHPMLARTESSLESLKLRRPSLAP